MFNKFIDWIQFRIHVFMHRRRVLINPKPEQPRKSLRDHLNELDENRQSRKIEKTRVRVGTDGRYNLRPPGPPPRTISSRPPPPPRPIDSMRARLEKALEDAERNARQSAQRDDMIRLAKVLNSAHEDVNNETTKKDN